ncbi:MAG: hypothetical protein Unbinned4585contig1001_8 [Prokaryotic dsDNA virus sp.]|nr:MAG: hypothetical protein Unbinned4585contig1001_8 [Prokaryotic dsDNA virus sp.]|tara:strand:+ start:2152 stop:2676 length:525 start_codon:yes stop_codon:yes gene_type:complete
MNKIYKIIGSLRSVFMGIASQYTNKKYESEDAVQMCLLYFLQMNPDTLKKVYEKDGKKGLIKYGAIILRRSFTSPRSEYYYTYKKCYEKEWSKADKFDTVIYEEDNNSTWEYFEKIDMELDKLYWYDKEIYKLYYNVEGETLDGLAKKTKISRNSLFTTIDNVRKHLKKVLKDE